MKGINMKCHLIVLPQVMAPLVALCLAGSAHLAQGSRSIPSDRDIGVWDPVSRTYTLTTDVNEPVLIEEDDLTLDGAGYTITAGESGYGVSLVSRQGVTIRNVRTSGCYYGIRLAGSHGNTISGNNCFQNYQGGICLDHSENNTVEDNTAVQTLGGQYPWGDFGIAALSANYNIIRDNVASQNGWGIHAYYSDGNTVIGNTANDCERGGVYFYYCNDSTASDNTVLCGDTPGVNQVGVGIHGGSRNVAEGNLVESSDRYGILVIHRTTDNIIRGNTIRNGAGIFLSDASCSVLEQNSVSDTGCAIMIAHASAGNIVLGNTLWHNGCGIHLCWEGTVDNLIYNNNFVENSIHAQDEVPGQPNVFNLDPPIGGNYWSGWTSPDVDGDGFVDVPYVFTGGQDSLPLVSPVSSTGYTRPGDDVVVSDPVSGTALSFDTVESGGETTVNLSSIGEGPPPPTGLKLVPLGIYYEIETTAVFTGPVQIAIQYDDAGLTPGQEANLTLRCYEEADGEWVDITTGLDTENNVIYGETLHLSFFAVSYNVPPEAMIEAPASGFITRVGEWVNFVGAFSDPDVEDIQVATWTVSDGFVSQTFAGSIDGALVTGSFQFNQAGIYQVILTITDDSGAAAATSVVNNDPNLPAFVVVYDPEGGFVTGGGWLHSPAGALLGTETTGKATFGFVAKYKKGANLPEGNTEFQFHAADFRFRSVSYDWLVIAGSKAKYKGLGKIDGVEGLFAFMLTAIDDPEGDRFRLKVWDLATDLVIYDNQRGDPEDQLDDATRIGGGSIVIHKGT